MKLDSCSSTAEYWGKVIDCRCLNLTIDFYSLSTKNAIAMATDIIGWLSKQMENRFWSTRCIDQKNVRKEQVLSKLKEEMSSRNFVFYREEAMAVSSVVYNLKTYKSYLRRNYIYGTPPLREDVSVDYPMFWTGLFQEKKTDPDKILQNVLRILREEGRKHLGGFYMPDVTTVMHILPYQGQCGCYYGSINIRFSAFCLNSQLEAMANEMKKFAEYLAQVYRNANIKIALQPVSAFSNPYMQLFGVHAYTDGSHIDVNCPKKEWYSTYYLSSVEWFNLISPLTQNHFSDVSAFENHQSFVSREKLGESLVVKSKKPITQFDISDALEMKKILCPALYPGGSDLPLSLFCNGRMGVLPRSTWGIVPVFEEEVYILPGYLVFKSANSS